MFYTRACAALGYVWPVRWLVSPGRDGRPVVFAFRNQRVYSSAYRCVEAVAPPGLHLLVRLLLWPFSLLDWAAEVVYTAPRTLVGIWRLPNFSLPWPPLP